MLNIGLADPAKPPSFRVASMNYDSDVKMLLDRQQLRRHQGIPTLTVFVGPVGAGIHAWKKWNGSRPVAMRSTNAAATLVVSWTAAAIASGALRAAAIHWFAEATGLSSSWAEARWLTSTLHDLDRALEVIPNSKDAMVAVCRCLLATGPQLGPVESRSMAEELYAASHGRGESEEAFLGDLAGLMSPDHRPAILLIPEVQNVEQSVRFLSRVLAAAPTVPVALAITDDVAESALKQAPEDRWRAILREGMVRVQGVQREAVLESLRAGGLGALDLSTSLDVLVAGGASADEIDQFVEAASALTPKANEEEEDRARSSAERFLFGLLDSLPQTVGAFQLNQQLEFQHGSRAAEADLVAADYKLVVEIDGSYYHLSSKDAYRRDRAKDWLFQQHGYRVLRFLADDVVSRLEDILNTIITALERCRSDLNHKGGSP